MILQPIQIQLKDGRQAVLRSPEVVDAADLLAYITKACGETEFLARYPQRDGRLQSEFLMQKHL